MPWFDDVQLILIVILSIIALNCILFLFVIRKIGRSRFREKIINDTDSVSQKSQLLAECQFKNQKRVLFVVKDLSDLVLYFGPILFEVLRKNCDVFLICVRPCFGDKYIWSKNCADILCQTMGFPISNVIFIWDEHFPETRNASGNDPWPIPRLMRMIRSYLFAYDIDCVITYDCDGINEDYARQALNEAVRGLWRKKTLPRDTKIYLLTSVSILHSMAGLFDTPFRCISSVPEFPSTQFLSSLEEFMVLQRLYLLFEWYDVNRNSISLVRTFLFLFLNTYFLGNSYHKIQDEEKYHL